MTLRLGSSFIPMLAACGASGGGPGPSSTPATPAGEFVPDTLGGAAFGARATLVFGPGDAASGQGPCNGWSAREAGPLPAFCAGPVVATRMACPDLAAETDFFAALAAATRAGLTGNRLVLSGSGGAELVFRARPPAPQP